MTTIGIVGSEAAKFTPETEALARACIRDIIAPFGCVVSGGCHLGGIDVWTIEEAKLAGKQIEEFIPKNRTWGGAHGYQARNLQIATASDYVVCITVKELPPHYTGIRFDWCYHCMSKEHVKSGGCWTVKQAKRLGKRGDVIVIG